MMDDERAALDFVQQNNGLKGLTALLIFMFGLIEGRWEVSALKERRKAGRSACT
jgi:hypothetical protein